jgi:hypothetical protein
MAKTALNSLFTKESLFSLQGAAAATLIIPNVLGYLIGPDFYPYQKWTGFGVAMLLALFTAAQAPSKDSSKWLMAVFNGFLIFASAAGLTDALGGSRPPSTADVPSTVNSFFHSWYH